MKNHLYILMFLFLLAAQPALAQYSVDQILGFPSPENLVASPVGSTIAWTFNERGVRNIYVAEGPAFAARKVTSYTQDDGQELTQLSFSRDGKTIVYVRGGDHGSGRQGDGPPNPAQSPIQPRIQIWSIPTTGGSPKLVADGDNPVLAPDSDRIAFTRDRRIWFVPIDGSKQPQPAFYARGTSDDPAWSPDGKTLAFVSNRGDHSFIGLFTTADQPIRFIDPSTSRDSMPAWSPEGRLAFLRQPGAGGTPRPPLAARNDVPWKIMVADVESLKVTAAVTSGEAPADPILQNPGGIGLQWAADDTLLFMSYRDGFPHLYSLQHPGSGSKPLLLTSGSFMLEKITLSPDRRV